MTPPKEAEKKEAKLISPAECKTEKEKDKRDDATDSKTSLRSGAENLRQIFEKRLPRAESVEYHPDDRIIITQVPLPSATSSLETLYFLPSRQYNEPTSTEDIKIKPESISEPSKCNIGTIAEVGFISNKDDPCVKYLEICSWIFTKADQIQESNKTAIGILLKRVELKVRPLPVDPDDEMSQIEAWKFIIEESLRLIGRDKRTSESIKSLATQISRDICSCKSRFSKLHKSATSLYNMLSSTQNEMQSWKQEVLKECSSVSKTIEDMEIIEEGILENNFKQMSEIQEAMTGRITVRWSLDGINLKLSHDWIKLDSCIPHHKLLFVDLFSTQLGQLAEGVETLLISSQDRLRRNPNVRSTYSLEIPDYATMGIAELLSKLFKILKSTNNIKYLTPKEKRLILNASSSMLSKIKTVRNDVEKLVKVTSKSQILMNSLCKAKNDLIRNKYSRPQHIMDYRLTFHLYILSDSHLAGLFACYAQSPDTTEEFHSRTSVGIHVEPSPLESDSFFSTTSTDLNQIAVVGPQSPIKKIFECGNVENDYDNAITSLRRTGIVDSNSFNLCSDKVQLFFLNSKSFVNTYTENIEHLRNLFGELRWGGHEDLPGLLFWAIMTARTLALTNLKKNTSRYWNSKIKELIREVREQSSWMLNTFSNYAKIVKTEENQLFSLGKTLSDSDRLIEEKLSAGQFSQSSDVEKEDISSVFRIAESDRSTTVRITVTPDEYYLIFFRDKCEAKKSLVVGFKDSAQENQFKIVKVAVDEILNRIETFKQTLDKIRMDDQVHTHTLKSALSGIFTYKDFKILCPLERSVIAHSMKLVDECFIRFNQNIIMIQNIFDKYQHLVNVIDYMNILKLQRGGDKLLEEIIVGRKDQNALLDAIKSLKTLRVVNYIPPKNGRIQKRLEDIVQPQEVLVQETHDRDCKLQDSNRRIQKQPEEIVHLHEVFIEDTHKKYLQPKHRYHRIAKAVYNYVDDEAIPTENFANQNPNSKPDEFNYDDWLKPLGETGEFHPDPVPTPQQLLPATIEPVKPISHLLELVTKFSQSLVNPTLAVLKVLLSPAVDNIEVSIGYFQCLSFLISVGCAQLNTFKIIELKEGDHIRKQCWHLTRLTGQILNQLTEAKTFIKENIGVLSVAMKSNTKIAMRKIHLNHARDMEECLNSRDEIMDESAANLKILDKLESGNERNLKCPGLKLFWDGSSVDERLQLETSDGQQFDFSDLTVSYQLKLLTQMTRTALQVLHRVFNALENAKPSHDFAFALLRSIADFTSEERSKRFKPEENYTMHRTIYERIVISNVTFRLIETVLNRSNKSLLQGFNMVFSKLQRKSEVSIFSDERKPLLYKTFTLTLDSNWRPATTNQTIPESSPEVSNSHGGETEEIPGPSSTVFPQFISSLRTLTVEDIGKLILADIIAIQTVFRTVDDSTYTGLFGLETLVGHAILEMKELKGLAAERKHDLKYSFKGTVTAATYFRDKAFCAFMKSMKSTKKVILGMIFSTPIFDKKAKNQVLPDRDLDPISKSTIDLLTGRRTTSQSQVQMSGESSIKSAENWVMCLSHVGSNIQLLPLGDKQKRRQPFAGLSKDKQAEVTIRLLNVTRHLFNLASEIAEKSVNVDTRKTNESVESLMAGLKRSTDQNNFNIEEVIESREVLQIILAAISQAKIMLNKIQEDSDAICERLEYINLFRKLRLMSAHDLQPRSKNFKRKIRIEKYIQNLHTFPVSVRLPLDI